MVWKVDAHPHPLVVVWKVDAQPPGMSALGVVVIEPLAVLSVLNTVQSLARVQQAVLVPHLRAPKAVPMQRVHR